MVPYEKYSQTRNTIWFVLINMLKKIYVTNKKRILIKGDLMRPGGKFKKNIPDNTKDSCEQWI